MSDSIQWMMGVMACAIILAYPTHGQDQSPKAATSAVFSLGDDFKKIAAEFQKALDDWEKAAAQAKTDAQRKKLISPWEVFERRAFDWIHAHPDDPAAVDAHIWIISHFNLDPAVDECVRALRAKHLESEKLSRLFQWFGFIWANSKQVEPMLRDAIERSPHRSVRGQACFSLAKFLKERAESAGDRGSLKSAEMLFERVIAEFGDLPGDDPNTHDVDDKGTLAEESKTFLSDLRHRAIGKVAPEIEGEDADGQKFKLSDYRGKVVVIDFWGDW